MTLALQEFISSSKDWLVNYFNNGVIKIFLSWSSNIYMVGLLSSQILKVDILKNLFGSSGRFLFISGGINYCLGISKLSTLNI